jgi:hypothetical protein
MLSCIITEKKVDNEITFFPIYMSSAIWNKVIVTKRVEWMDRRHCRGFFVSHDHVYIYISCACEKHKSHSFLYTTHTHHSPPIPQVDDYGYRILQESTGNNRKWKQYSHRNLSDFFPVDSSQFPELSDRNRSEIIGKNPKFFRWEYCFHVPAISGAVLPEPARIFRPGT